MWMQWPSALATQVTLLPLGVMAPASAAVCLGMAGCRELAGRPSLAGCAFCRVLLPASCTISRVLRPPPCRLRGNRPPNTEEVAMHLRVSSRYRKQRSWRGRQLCLPRQPSCCSAEFFRSMAAWLRVLGADACVPCLCCAARPR